MARTLTTHPDSLVLLAEALDYQMLALFGRAFMRRREPDVASSVLSTDRPRSLPVGRDLLGRERHPIQPASVIRIQDLSLLSVELSHLRTPSSACDLLDASLRPAPELSNLSPADRLFGWVRQSAESPGSPEGAAWRDRPRIKTTLTACAG